MTQIWVDPEFGRSLYGKALEISYRLAFDAAMRTSDIAMAEVARLQTENERLRHYGCDDCASEAARKAAVVERDRYRKALEWISQGKGRYSIDPLVHADNCIEDMKTAAINALAGKDESND